MNNDEYYHISNNDKEILKSLGEKVFLIAQSAEMKEKKLLWKKLNMLEAERPMILFETGEISNDLVPVNTLVCKGEWARNVERNLKLKIYHAENICDDMVIEPRITYGYKIHSSDFGVDVKIHRGDHSEGKGSMRWDAPITDIEEGLKKLHFREHGIDYEATEKNKALLEYVFSGILSIEHRGWYWWTQGLSIDAINLVGLEGFMLAMYDQPDQLHALMAFLRDERINMLAWFEKEGLLFPNNEDDYIGSGSIGYTDQLPREDYVSSRPGRLKDMWGLSESQETVGVSPEMFEEFVFQYQIPVISKFGLACYGCCEPLDKRWHIIKNLPNLRRVSVSPWANEEKMAQFLGKNYIYSRKPNPSDVSTDFWDEALLRDGLKKTMDLTRGMNVEFVMKDVHTISKQAWRPGRWVQIVRNILENY